LSLLEVVLVDQIILVVEQELVAQQVGEVLEDIDHQ
tara:strand:+ start:77 stop:184 length:108 start_codon:yes stop_codon:yes gene_type:complete